MVSCFWGFYLNRHFINETLVDCFIMERLSECSWVGFLDRRLWRFGRRRRDFI
jgi:hypothetical protein